MKRLSIAGETYNDVYIIADEPAINGRSRVLCRCHCGTEFHTDAKSIRRGLTKSCGCIQKANLERGLRFRHGSNASPEYRIWKGIRTRCNNPNRKDYKNYGAIGITMCPEWDSFEQFLSDIGPRPSPQHTIDRKDNALGYQPGNCVWSTKIVQANNTRRNLMVTVDGASMSLADCCRKYNRPYNIIHGRLQCGWTIEDALFKMPPADRNAEWTD